MKYFFLVLGFLLSYRIQADTLLILTEPQARSYMGTQMDELAYYAKREGRYTNVVIRELPRWTGSYSTNDWPGLNRMSNEVRRINPNAILIAGHLPILITGGRNPDGHYLRCVTTDAWLGCTNITFSDSLNWGMDGSTTLAFNTPGDGKPDEVSGTFAIPVSRIDFQGMTADVATLSGCLTGLLSQPNVDEQFATKRYWTNNFAFRNKRWSVSETGYVSGVLWAAADITKITGTNTAVSWTTSSSIIGGGSSPRWFYDNNALSEIPNFYDGGCNPVRGFMCATYRSFGMESYDGGKSQMRRLQPGRQDNCYFLNAGWTAGNTHGEVFWLSRPSDTHVADIVASSVYYWGGAGNTTWIWTYWLAGDVSLPCDPITTPPAGTATFNTATVTQILP